MLRVVLDEVLPERLTMFKDGVGTSNVDMGDSVIPLRTRNGDGGGCDGAATSVSDKEAGVDLMIW